MTLTVSPAESSASFEKIEILQTNHKILPQDLYLCYTPLEVILPESQRERGYLLGFLTDKLSFLVPLFVVAGVFDNQEMNQSSFFRICGKGFHLFQKFVAVDGNVKGLVKRLLCISFIWGMSPASQGHGRQLEAARVWA